MEVKSNKPNCENVDIVAFTNCSAYDTQPDEDGIKIPERHVERIISEYVNTPHCIEDAAHRNLKIIITKPPCTIGHKCIEYFINPHTKRNLFEESSFRHVTGQDRCNL